MSLNSIRFRFGPPNLPLLLIINSLPSQYLLGSLNPLVHHGNH
nr:MAG TPA: hypothetical protein [Caudoviricetes sp.]